MAFTNVYDDTFPADTELANLIGANLRQVRLDVQQRMAAISGLDAAKPNFAGDAQPANWTGILFFATDTGQIYQFNGATWTNVTALVGSGRILGTPGGGGVVVGGTAYYAGLYGGGNFVGTVETAVQCVLPTSGTFKALYVYISSAQNAAGTLVINLRIAGATVATLTIPASSVIGVYSTTFNVAFTAGNLADYQAINNGTGTPASTVIASLGLVY